MSLATTRHRPRFPIPTLLDSPGRRRGRRRSAQQRPAVDRLEGRTLMAFNPISQPTAAYVAGTHLIPITGNDFSSTTSLTDGSETVTFSSSMQTRTVPGNWSNWGSPPDTESATPRVLYSQLAQSVTLTFSQPVSAFGVEMEQNLENNTDTLIADFFNGATLVGSVSRSITTPGVPGGPANQGARLFAASSDGSSPLFTRVVLHTQNDDFGFAIAQVRYAQPTADLAITKTDSPDPVIAGNNITYNIAITNNGPRDAPAYNLFDANPPGTSFVSFTQTGGPALGSTLPVGATGSFQLVLKVNSNVAAGTVLTNLATASSALPDIKTGDNVATTTTTVNTSADLVASKVDTPDPVVAGTNLTYTITITNNGPSDAQGWNLSDTLPAGTSLVSITQTGGPPAGGPLPAGASGTAVLVAHVDPSVPAGTVLTNTVRPTSSTPDPNPGNDTGTATTTVITSADLAVTKTDSPDPVVAGTRLTYTINLANNGPSDAQTVNLSDTLPAGTTFVSSTAPGGWATTSPPVGGTGAVTFTRTTLAAAGSATFNIVVLVGANVANNSTISNTATATSTTPDPTPGNNSATATTTVTTSADLAVTKTDSPDPVVAGTDLTYSITLANNGPSDAQTVNVADTLPTGTTFVSSTAPAGWATSSPAVGGTGTVTFSRATVSAGATPVFSIIVHVGPSVANNSTISNSATATSTTSDPAPGNNTGTATTTVITSADLAVTKTGSPDPVIAGTDLTYSITLANNGPSDAQSVNLADTLPAGTTFVTSTAPAGWATSSPAVGGTGTVTFSRSTLALGGSGAFTIVVHVASSVPEGTILSNTATASSTTSDPNPGNNSATANTRVITSADLAVTKIGDNPGPLNPGDIITYTIGFTNNGPSDAVGVNVSDTLPPGTALVSPIAPAGWTTTFPGHTDPRVLTFSNGAVPVGTSISFYVVVQVTTASGTVTNTVNASSRTPDPNPGNNSARVDTPVNGLADLVITKTATPNPVGAGGNLTYTLTVRNAGAVAASAVTLRDSLPEQTAFVSSTTPAGWTATNPAVGAMGGVVVDTTPSLAPGAAATFVIVVRVAPGTPIGTVLTNRASVRTTTNESDTTNNDVSRQVTVGQPQPGDPSANAKPNVAMTTIGAPISPTTLIAPPASTQAADVVLGSSSGLVADVLRQKQRGGIFTF